MEAMREETQAEEQQIVRERVQSEARLAALAVLQRPIRELLPTLPPAVALGHHAPVRDAIELMRQKQLSCVLVVEHGELVGVLTERDVVTKVAATPLDVDHVPLREVMQPDPECFASGRCPRVCLPPDASRRLPACPRGGRAAALRLVSMQAIIDELVAAFPQELLNLRRPRRTPSPPRQKARKRGAPEAQGIGRGDSVVAHKGADCAFLLPAAPLTRLPTDRFGCLRPCPHWSPRHIPSTGNTPIEIPRYCLDCG